MSVSDKRLIRVRWRTLSTEVWQMILLIAMARSRVNVRASLLESRRVEAIWTTMGAILRIVERSIQLMKPLMALICLHT